METGGQRRRVETETDRLMRSAGQTNGRFVRGGERKQEAIRQETKQEVPPGDELVMNWESKGTNWFLPRVLQNRP